MEDAIVKACEIERERVKYSYMPVLEEMYEPGWEGWKNLPAVDFVQSLIEWQKANERDFRDEPWFPKITCCPYVWKGELSYQNFIQLAPFQYASAVNVFAAESFAISKAYAAGEREVRQLVAWHMIDEEFHGEMLRDSLVNHLKVEPNTLDQESNKMTEELFILPPKNEIDKKMIKSMNRAQAFRDGPSILAGAVMLHEMDNVWSFKKTLPAMKEIYKLSNDAMPFYNIHSYIDIFHHRIGLYLLGKYALTRELQDLCRAFFEALKEKQYHGSKEFYERLFQEKKATRTREGYF